MWSDEGYKMSTNVSCFSGVSVMMNVTHKRIETLERQLSFLHRLFISLCMHANFVY